MNKSTKLQRAQGCLLGQLAGDSLGSLVEFKSGQEIKSAYPKGVKELADGGVWCTLAGQPTDDSEMALLLARSLVLDGHYDSQKVLDSYKYWLSSGPFDVGTTIANSLGGQTNPDSQANGALMRVSPLGIFGAGQKREIVAAWAMTDAALTHVHPVCQEVNALYVMAIAYAIENDPTPWGLYEKIAGWATEMQVSESVRDAIHRAYDQPPAEYSKKMGWVLIAFQNALYQLKNAKTLAAGVSNTVERGGDTDTNAAICGALMGAVYGRDAIPAQWQECILNCRPDIDDPKVLRPRPKVFWPADALELAEGLLKGR